MPRRQLEERHSVQPMHRRLQCLHLCHKLLGLRLTLCAIWHVMR